LSTFGTFILAMTLTLTMVISAITLSNPIQPAVSTVEEDKDKENKNEEKEELKADGQGNDGAEEEEQEPNGDEEEGAQEGDPDVDQELLDELRGGETVKEGSETAGGEESEGDSDNLSREELEAELRGGDITKQAPVAISGENVYTVWWTNNTANRNDEVMFRASTDGGAIFGNKTNLSNTTGADSVDAMIDAEGGNIAITWWERNQTINNPVTRISNDNGETFGPMLVLATNGTLGEMEEEPEEGE
jgi:hypothetical protein